MKVKQPKAPTADLIRNCRITITAPKKIYEGVVALSQISGTSINDFVLDVLDSVVDNNAEAIAKVESARKEAKKNVNPVASFTFPKETGSIDESNLNLFGDGSDTDN